MPKGKGKTYRYHDEHGKVFPFYAPTEAKSIGYALEWSRRMGIKLYRKKV